MLELRCPECLVWMMGSFEHARVAEYDDALVKARAEIDQELKARLEELQAKAPGKHEISPYGGIVLETGILFASGHHELTKEGQEALVPLVGVGAGMTWASAVLRWSTAPAREDLG
jgi:hypothetical protein